MTEKPRYSPQDIHLETARITWPELERHFARGVVIEVAAELDLVDVASCFANDDKQRVAPWTETGRVRHLDIPTAQRWQEEAPDLWAVVMAPWVLVQERSGPPGTSN